MQQNSFQKRILIPQHQTIVCSAGACCLDASDFVPVNLDSVLELFYVFCSPLSKSSLSIAIALPASFGCKDLPISLAGK